MDIAANMYPDGYIFKVLLMRDHLNQPILHNNDTYVFLLTEDSSHLFVPIEAVDISADIITIGYNPQNHGDREYPLELHLGGGVPVPAPTIEITQNSINDMDEADQDHVLGDSVDTCFWSEEATKLLISLYPQYRLKVSNRTIKSQEKMWRPLSEELNANGKNYSYTDLQCKNKWKTLERAYKKVIDNKKLTGRGRKTCAFEKQLNEVFAKRDNVFPEITMGTGQPQTKKMVLEKCTTETIDDESSTLSLASTSGTQGPTKPIVTVKPKRERSRSVALELKAFRKETADRQEARQATFEARENKKIEIMEERNRLLKRTNELLEKLLAADNKL